MPRAQRGDGCAPPQRWEQERGSAPRTGTRSNTLTVVPGGHGTGDTRHRGPRQWLRGLSGSCSPMGEGSGCGVR